VTCPFNLTGAGTFQGTSNIVVTYSGTSCNGAGQRDGNHQALTGFRFPFLFQFVLGDGFSTPSSLLRKERAREFWRHREPWNRNRNPRARLL
jgi:hypothetical protein